MTPVITSIAEAGPITALAVACWNTSTPKGDFADVLADVFGGNVEDGLTLTENAPAVDGKTADTRVKTSSSKGREVPEKDTAQRELIETNNSSPIPLAVISSPLLASFGADPVASSTGTTEGAVATGNDDACVATPESPCNSVGQISVPAPKDTAADVETTAANEGTGGRGFTNDSQSDNVAQNAGQGVRAENPVNSSIGAGSTIPLRPELVVPARPESIPKLPSKSEQGQQVVPPSGDVNFSSSAAPVSGSMTLPNGVQPVADELVNAVRENDAVGSGSEGNHERGSKASLSSASHRSAKSSGGGDSSIVGAEPNAGQAQHGLQDKAAVETTAMRDTSNSPAAGTVPVASTHEPASNSQFPQSQAAGGTHTKAGTAEAPAVDPNSPVQLARMVGKGEQAEMHVALRTAGFGNVEVHASIRADQVGVSFGSERNDLHAALAANLPSLESSMRQHDLRLNTVQFLMHAQTAADGSPSGNHEGRWHRQAAATPVAVDQPETSETILSAATEVAHARGFSIHA